MLLLYAVPWGIAIVYLNYVASCAATKRARAIPDQPLPDLLHDLLPQLDNHVPDYLLLLCVAYACALAVVHGTSVMARHNVDSLLACLTLRPIFLCLTSFPTCYQTGIRPDQETASLYTTLFLNKHDLMFSGHTCCFVFFGHVFGGALGWLARFALPFSLVAARYHYTIDVVVAMMVYHIVYSCAQIS